MVTDSEHAITWILCDRLYSQLLTQLSHRLKLHKIQQNLRRGLCAHKIGLSPAPSNITDRSKTVLLFWFILIVFVRPLSVCLLPFVARQANLCLRAFRHDKFLLRMSSHSEGPGIWLSIWRFLLTPCLYERAAEVLARCADSPEPSLLA